MGSETPPIVFDEENPEWSKADFARARPGSEVLPEAVLAAFGEPRGRARGMFKRSVTLRLDQDVLERFRADGRAGIPASTPRCARPWGFRLNRPGDISPAGSADQVARSWRAPHQARDPGKRARAAGYRIKRTAEDAFNQDRPGVPPPSLAKLEPAPRDPAADDDPGFWPLDKPPDEYPR